jgi:hypothetical protein
MTRRWREVDSNLQYRVNVLLAIREDFEAFDKTIGCHSSPDPVQPFFNLIICRARLSPSPG